MALKRWGASVDFIRCSTSPFHPFVGFLFKSPVKNLTWNLEEIRLLKHLRKRVDGPSNTCSPKARLAVGEVVQFVAFSGWWFWRKETTIQGTSTNHQPLWGVQRLVSPKKMAAKTSKTSRSGIKYKADSLALEHFDSQWECLKGPPQKHTTPTKPGPGSFPRRSVGLMKGCY